MSRHHNTPANTFFAELNELVEKNPEATRFLVSKKMASGLVSMDRDDWINAGCSRATAGERLRLFDNYVNEGINHLKIGTYSFELSEEFEHPIRIVS